MSENHLNFTLTNLRVDGTTVGRLVGVGLGVAGGGSPGAAASTLDGMLLSNIVVRSPLQWLPTNVSAAVAGSNFIAASAPDTISGVRVESVQVAGKHLRANADWNMVIVGDGAADITYV
jgi:hypothetical protein